jgi:hypothetical protein
VNAKRGCEGTGQGKVYSVARERVAGERGIADGEQATAHGFLRPLDESGSPVWTLKPSPTKPPAGGKILAEDLLRGALFRGRLGRLRVYDTDCHPLRHAQSICPTVRQRCPCSAQVCGRRDASEDVGNLSPKVLARPSPACAPTCGIDASATCDLDAVDTEDKTLFIHHGSREPGNINYGNSCRLCQGKSGAGQA